MSERIEGKDLYQKGAIDPLIDDFKKVLLLQKDINEENERIKKTTAEAVKSSRAAATGGGSGQGVLDANKKLNEQLKQKIELSKKEQSLLQSIEISKQKEAKTRADVAKAAQQEAKIITEQNRARDVENRTMIREQKERERLERQQNKNNDLYALEQRRLTALRREATNVGIELNRLAKEGKQDTVEFGKLEKQFKETQQEAIELDKELKDLRLSLNDNRVEVGNYSGALDEFAKKLQDVKSLDIKSILSPQNLALGAAVTGLTAIGSELLDVTKKFENLRLSASRLGFAGQDIEDVAVNTSALVDTFGDDSKDVLQAQNVLIKEFGVTTEEAFNILNNGYSSAANVQGDLLDSVKEYSAQINASGGSANDLVAILNASGKEGIFSDKGVDVVKEFGLRIREQTTATKEALENAFGKEFSDRILGGINDGSITSVEALKEVSKQLNNTSIPANKLQTVIADVFGGAGEDAGLRYLQNLKDIGAETGELIDTNDPLIKQQQTTLELNKELSQAQNDLAESFLGTGATLDQLAIKIKTIFIKLIPSAISFIKRATVAFAAYKVALFSLKMADRVKEWKDYRKAVKSGSKSMNNASKEAKSFGRSMKAIGWSALISAAWALANTFIDIANSIDVANREAQTFNDINEISTGITNKNIESIKAQIEEQSKLLQVQVSNGKISEEEANKRLKSFIDEERFLESTSKSWKNYSGTVTDVYGGFSKQVELLIKEQENAIGFALANIKLMQKEGEVSAFKNRLKIADERASIKNAKEQIELLKEFIIELDNEQFQRQINANESNKHDKFELKNLDEKIKKRKELSEIDITKALESEPIDAQGALLDRLAKQEEAVGRFLTKRQIELTNARRNEEITEKEFNEQLLIAEIEALLQRIELRKDYGEDTLDLERDLAAKRLELVNASNEDINKSDEEAAKLAAQAAKDRAELLKFIADELTDHLTRRADERISLLDKEIAAEERQLERLNELSKQGAENAEDSVAESEARLARLNARRQDEERKKAQIQLISSGLEIFAAKVEGGESDASAAAQTLATIQLLSTALKAIPVFWEGTDWNVKDKLGSPNYSVGRDGYLVRVDGTEGIADKENMDKAKAAGYNKIDDVFDAAVSAKEISRQAIPEVMYKHAILDTSGVSVNNQFDVSGLINKLDSVEQAIINKQESSIDLEAISQTAGLIRKKTKHKGNYYTQNMVIKNQNNL